MRSNLQRNSHSEYYSGEQVRTVLQEIGVQIASELSSHFMIMCPYHNNRSTPACEIEKSRGLFVCFSCGASGNLIKMVMDVDDRSWIEAHRLVAKHKQSDDILSIVNDLDPEPEVEFDSSVIDKLHSELLQSKRGQQYWRKRGIARPTAVEFSLGYSERRDMIIIPVQNEHGKHIGFIGRSVVGKQFRNSEGMRKTAFVFNLHRVQAAPQIVVVESAIDAMLLWQQGVSAVAVMGNSPSKRQTDLLKRAASGIIVIPDNDKAGSKMLHLIMDRLPEKFIGAQRVPGGKDIGELSPAQLKQFAQSIGKNQLI